MALHLDFETRSKTDLKGVGLWNYARHESTEILCVGFSLDGKTVRVVDPRDLPQEFLDRVELGEEVVAHNAQFELAIWNEVGRRHFGWPKFAISQAVCTMARAYRMGLPGSLDAAAAALGLEVRKDDKGRRLMLKMCKPFRGQWWDGPEERARLKDYCAVDVEVEILLDERLLPLPPKERKLWILDQKINRRGIGVDVDSARRALQVIARESDRLHQAMRDVTENQVATCSAVGQLKEWITKRGYPVEGVGKPVLDNLLTRDIPVDVRKAVLLRLEASKTSTAKLKSMVSNSGTDGRIRYCLQYHGASTGRWAGRIIQPQNFPRPPKGFTHTHARRVIEALNTDDPEARIRGRFKHLSVTEAISASLRAFILGTAGRDLTAMDFSAIEARVLAWLADQRNVLGIFKGDGLIYEAAAAEIFGVDISKVTKEQRAVGKVAILALGYQGGPKAFQAMAVGYGVSLAPVFDHIWARADSEMQEKAERSWSQAVAEAKKKGKPVGSTKREWLAADVIKMFWRLANPKIVSYWYAVEQAAHQAVAYPDTVIEAGPPGRKVKFAKRGSFLFCRLPSGRALSYPYPRIAEVKTSWGERKSAVTYKTVDSVTRKFIRVPAYGGKLVENITQAVARDLLVHAAFRCEENGYRVAFHVHDELVLEHPRWLGSIRKVQELMETPPRWAQGLPIAADGWRGRRYRK